MLVACCACGRLAFDPRSDGRVDDGGASDGIGIDAVPTCANWGPFSGVVNVTPLNSSNEEYAVGVSADGLDIVFDSDRPGGLGMYDLYEATRASTTQAFGPPVRLANINSSQSDDNPALSTDGKTIYFSSTRTGTGRIYSASRADRSQPFGAPTLLGGEVNTPFSVCCPGISADELSMVVSVDMTGGGVDYEVYSVSRSDRTADFANLTHITSASSSANDWAPALSADGLELFFQTDRNPNYDIYVSRRATTSDAWPTGVGLAGLATTNVGETDPTLSFDGTTMWFAMNGAPGGLGAGDLWFATRACQ